MSMAIAAVYCTEFGCLLVMRYLRMLTNSLLAALLAAGFVLTLVLQLNPTLPLHPLRVLPIATTVGVFYAIHLTVIFYLALVMRQLLARELFSPGWVSVGVLTWLAAAAAAAGAGLMWANLRAFELVLEPETSRRMANGTLMLVMSAALFVFVGLLRGHLGAARRPVWAVLFVTVMVGSVVAPLAMRGRAIPPLAEAQHVAATFDLSAAERVERITMLAIDGGSLDFITRATAEGRLPNFGRILDGGGVMRLATLRPTSAEAVWAAAATGKLPQKNGVRSAGSYRLPRGGEPIQLLPDYCLSHVLVRFGFLLEQPHSSATFRTRTIWDILSGLGISAGVVAWPLTYPAQPVRGYLVSDLYYRLIQTPSGIDDQSAVYPPEVRLDVFRAMEAAAADGAPVVKAADVDGRYEIPARTDRVYDSIGRELAASHPTKITITRYQSLDVIGHHFLRYAMPSEFGDVNDEDRQKWGAVLEQHYSVIDDAVGRAMGSIGSDDLLLIVSGYGMEPMGFAKRTLERLVGDPDLNGTHEAAPDGFLLAYGGPVARRRSGIRASIVDVVPTILYFLGLPIGRDMDGQARTELFRPSFTEDRPITYIPTYDR
jgi:predicted AlkP superfamily phosphohydrolase/phosphomutase